MSKTHPSGGHVYRSQTEQAYTARKMVTKGKSGRPGMTFARIYIVGLYNFSASVENVEV